MSSPDPLLTELRHLLPGTTSNYTAASKAYDVYEGFVFGLVVETADNCGANVRYATVQGASTTDLCFRTAPGQLYSDAQPYTHAVIEFFGAPPLEAHLGVRVQGGSGVLHECDVLVLSSAEAELSRNNRIAPRGSHCLLGVECKFYAASLGIDLARNFEGVHVDLRAKHEVFVANTDGVNVVKYLSARRRLLERSVTPGSPQAGYLKSHVREAFKSYLSIHAPSALI